MNQTIIIQGMHCEACKSLITMELEEAGLEDKVKTISLQDNNMGELELDDVSEEEVERIKTAINNMGSYSVV